MQKREINSERSINNDIHLSIDAEQHYLYGNNTYLLSVFLRLQFAQKIVQMYNRAYFQVVNKCRQDIVHLFTTVLQLGSLPHYVYVLVADLAFHCQKVEDNVALLNNLKQMVNIIMVK